MLMMTRFVFVLSIFIFLACSMSAGQDSIPKVQIFGGYSLLHADNGGLNGPALDAVFGTPAVDAVFGTPSGTFGMPANFSGWNTQIQFNARRSLGIVADLSGNYGSLFTTSSGSGISGLPPSHSYSFLFGPVFSAHASKFTPFVHALFGVNRLSSASTTSLTGVSFTSLPAVTDSAFAMALGGGVDYNVSSRFGLRLGQLDYLYTGHDLNGVANNIFGAGTFAGLATHQNNLRFSTGITFRF